MVRRLFLSRRIPALVVGLSERFPSSMRTLVAALVATLIALGACGGGDKATAPVPVASVSLSPLAVTLTVGATRQLTPTVLDATGNVLAGRAVTWSTSDATRATVSTTGLVAAVAIGSATVTATSEGKSAAAAITVTPGPASQLVVRTQPSGAQVGVALQTQPVIEARDANGALATGSAVVVTARLASGAGTLSGATSSTSINGVATFTGLTLTGVTGAKVLEFTSAGLPAVQASAVQLTAGPARQLILSSPLSATAMVTSPVDPQPVVQAVDEAGNATSFAGLVTAAVDSGDGMILAGGSTNTDAAGRGTFAGFTFGSLTGGPGPVRVRFSAPGLNVATSRVYLVCYNAEISLNTPVISAFAVGDCAFTIGTPFRTHSLVRTTPLSHVRMTVTGAFQPAAYFRGPNSPNRYWGRNAAAGSNSIAVEMLLPAGTTYLAPTTVLPGVTGAYNVRVDALSGDVSCITTYVGSPITSSQRLSSGDCTSGAFLGDFYYFGLPPGASVTASVTSTAFSPYVAVWQETPSERVASSSGTSTASTSFSNTGDSKLYYVYVGNLFANGSGAYSIAINITYPTQSTGVASSRAVSTDAALMVFPTASGRAALEARVLRDVKARP